MPELAGKTLGRARTALGAAHCALGRVSKPKRRKGHKLGHLVVHSFSPASGTTMPAEGKVDITLAHKFDKGKRGMRPPGSSRLIQRIASFLGFPVP